MSDQTNGKRDMSKKLNMDNNLKAWIEPMRVFYNGGVPNCPYCNTVLEACGARGEDYWGFMMLTCPKCDKTGWNSRLQYPEDTKVPLFEEVLNSI